MAMACYSPFDVVPSALAPPQPPAQSARMCHGTQLGAALPRGSGASTAAATPATKDYSRPLHVDCSVEYELPSQAKPPPGVKHEPLLMIHPCYYRRAESQRRSPFINNLPGTSGRSHHHQQNQSIQQQHHGSGGSHQQSGHVQHHQQQQHSIQQHLMAGNAQSSSSRRQHQSSAVATTASSRSLLAPPVTHHHQQVHVAQQQHQSILHVAHHSSAAHMQTHQQHLQQQHHISHHLHQHHHQQQQQHQQSSCYQSTAVAPVAQMHVANTTQHQIRYADPHQSAQIRSDVSSGVHHHSASATVHHAPHQISQQPQQVGHVIQQQAVSSAWPGADPSSIAVYKSAKAKAALTASQHHQQQLEAAMAAGLGQSMVGAMGAAANVRGDAGGDFGSGSDSGVSGGHWTDSERSPLAPELRLQRDFLGITNTAVIGGGGPDSGIATPVSLADDKGALTDMLSAPSGEGTMSISKGQRKSGEEVKQQGVHLQPAVGVAAVASSCKACRSGRDLHQQHSLLQQSTSTTSTPSTAAVPSYQRLLQQPWAGVTAPPHFHTPAVPSSRMHVGGHHHYSRAVRTSGDSLENSSSTASLHAQLRRSAAPWVRTGAAKRSRVSASQVDAASASTEATPALEGGQWASSFVVHTPVASAAPVTPAVAAAAPGVNGGWLPPPTSRQSGCREKDCNSVCKSCCSSSNNTTTNNTSSNASNNNANTSGGENVNVEAQNCNGQQQQTSYQTVLQQQQSQMQQQQPTLSQQQQWSSYYGVGHCRGASEDGSRILWNNENSLRLFQV